MRRSLENIALLLVTLALSACGSNLPGSGRPTSAADSVAEHYRVSLQPLDTTLFDSLRAIESRSGGKLGFSAIEVETGWRTVYRGGETFPMASVAKLPMAITFLRAVDSGRFRLDSIVRLTSADHRPGGSRLFYRITRNNFTPTLHDLLVAMITESDNTACDYILRLAGGPVAAKRLMNELGLADIDVSSYEGELILRWAGIDPAAGDSAWTRERIYARIEAAGKSSWDSARTALVDLPSDAARPESVGRLLTLLQQGRILSRRGTDTLLAIMGRTVTGKGRIPAQLPVGTPVAHKTGTIGTVANDVGIVTLPGGRHLAIAGLVKGSTASVRVRDQAIAAAAGLVYRRMLGKSSATPTTR